MVIKFLILLFQLFPLMASATPWFYVDRTDYFDSGVQDGGAKYFIDTEDISHFSYGYIAIWEKLEYHQMQNGLEKVEFNDLYGRVEINCFKKTRTIVGLVVVNTTKHKGYKPPLENFEEIETENVEPGSMKEKLLIAGCNLAGYLVF